MATTILGLFFDVISFLVMKFALLFSNLLPLPPRRQETKKK
jgi:hypothetical protein